MTFFTEMLNQGLVTSSDPALLKAGELQYMQNATYRRGSQALQRAKGRILYSTATGTTASVVGIKDATFDNGDHFLLTMVTVTGTGRFRFSRIPTTSVSATAGFQDVSNVTGIPGTTGLEIVQYRNRFYTFNGAAAASGSIGSNRVAYLSATGTALTPQGRQHGMLPVRTTPNVTTAAGVFSQTVTGYYEYWTTEVAKITQDGIPFLLEGSYAADPATVFVDSVGKVPVIPKPTFQNTLSNRWRVYRSPKKDALKDREFPSGFMIAELNQSVITHSDTLTTASASAFPGSFNGVSDGATINANFSNAGSLGADDGAYASGVGAIAFNTQMVYSFGFSGISGEIKGIEIEVQAYQSVGTGTTPIAVYIASDRNADGNIKLETGGSDPSSQGWAGAFGGLTNIKFAGKHGLITSTSSVSPTTLVLGSSTDRWFAPGKTGISDTDFNSNTFCVVLENSTSGKTLGVDYVKATVHYAASIDSVIQFPTVVYEFGDITSQVGKNHPPPNSSTGDIYQDALVVNDVSSPSLVRYSYPGDPEAFPPTYYLDFETDANDQVRLVKVVNNRLVVALDSSIWRVNYLPSERDASLDRGKATETISRSFGCLGPSMSCVFSLAGSTEQLAFVSRQGIHVTDGYNFDTITDELDWRQIISLGNKNVVLSCTTNGTTALTGSGFSGLTVGALITGAGIPAITTVSAIASDTALTMSASASDSATSPRTFVTQIVSGPVALINDPEQHELILYYQNDDHPTETYRALHYNYSSEHRKENGLYKWSGPVNIRNYDGSNYGDLKSSWAIPRHTGESTVFMGYSSSATGVGGIWLEAGTSIPAADEAMSYTTRRMYAAGFGNEWQMTDLYGYMSNQIGSPVIQYTARSTKTNAVAEVTKSSDEYVLGGEPMHTVRLDHQTEGTSITMDVVADHNDMACEFLVINGDGFGEQDSGL